MSIFIYNGIPLPYPFFTDFRQEAVYDDSVTDRYLTKFDIKLQTIINVNFINQLAPDYISGSSTVDNPAALMDIMRSRLLRPRRALSAKFNGYELIPQKQGTNTGTVDAKNGPLPQTCNLIQLTNQTFLCTFHIIAHYWENNTVNPQSNPSVTNQPGNDVLLNRWTETVDIDSCQYTKRTREGKFIIRSDNVDGIIADQLREQMAIVGVIPGYIRESSTYTVTPDGLAIQYRVIDREYFKNPPNPSYEASGEYIEIAPRFNTPIRVGEVRVKLKGAKNTDQNKLLYKAVQIAAAKLRIAGFNKILGGPNAVNVFGWLEGASVHVNMYENIVEVQMRAKILPRTDINGKGRVQGMWGPDFSQLTWTPGSDDDPNYQPIYTSRGTDGFLIQAAAYYDPSLRGVAINPNTSQLNAGLEVGQAGVNPE